MIKKYFDDYLGFLDYNFKKYKYIIFFGKSGSGKSSYINKLAEKNKTLKSNNFYIIDEIYDIFDFFSILKYLINSNKYIISSHISKKYFYLLRIFGKIKYINLDENIEKIFNYLDNKNIEYSQCYVIDFVKKYKANYTEIDIIMENNNGNDFDKSYKKFKKFNNIKYVGNKKEISLKKI